MFSIFPVWSKCPTLDGLTRARLPMVAAVAQPVVDLSALVTAHRAQNHRVKEAAEHSLVQVMNLYNLLSNLRESF